MKPHNECSWVYLDPSRVYSTRPVAVVFGLLCFESPVVPLSAVVAMIASNIER